jgi:hypothetical protein
MEDVMTIEELIAKRETVNTMTDGELIDFGEQEYKECGSSSDYVTDELFRRVHDEMKRQTNDLEDDERCAILQGFEISATWHTDALRFGWDKSIADAVAEYIKAERDVYADNKREKDYERMYPGGQGLDS